MAGKYDILVEDARKNILFKSSIVVNVVERVDLPLDPRLDYPVRVIVVGASKATPIVHNDVAMYEMVGG